MAKSKSQQVENVAPSDDPLTPEQRSYVDSGGAADAPAAPAASAPARRRGTRKDIPAEYRPYYVVFGQPADGRPLQRIARFKTKGQAEKWIGFSEELLKNSYTAVEIVYCKRKGFINLR